MRKVPIEYIREGNYLAKSIYSDKGILQVSKGVLLTKDILKKIVDNGYLSLYIQDENSEQEIEEIIAPQVRNKMRTIANTLANNVANLNNVKVKTTMIKTMHKVTEEMTSLIDSVIFDVMNTKEAILHLNSVSTYDNYTFDHSLNVMILAAVVGKKMGLKMDDIKNLAAGAIFHDIGKILIPKEILVKPGALDEEERKIIETHPQKGFDFLKDFTGLRSTTRIASIDHHEKWDGTGYPNGKKSTEINIMGRICAVCDVFEALIADRPYRKGKEPSEAREYLLGGCGRHFDLTIVDAFNRCINSYPLDTMVSLSNSWEGIVTKINGDFYNRPVVTVKCMNGKFTENFDVDLLLKTNMNIVINGIIHKFSYQKDLLNAV